MPTRLLSVLIAVCCLASGAVQAEDAAQDYAVPLGVVALDGVEGRLDHCAADIATGRVFVAGLENHSLEVIDLATRTRVASIPGLLEPQGLIFLPQSRLLLACSRGDGTCRAFDGQTLAAGAWIDLGRNADNVRWDAKDNMVYVGSGSEPGPGLLTAIDAAAFLGAMGGGAPGARASGADLLPGHPRQVGSVFEARLAAHPESFQIDAANRRIYANIPDGHQIAVLEMTAGGLTALPSWPVAAAERNFPLALDGASQRLFVVCRKPACVLVYDTRHGSVVAQAPCVGDADDAFFDAPTRTLYVIGGEGYVDAFTGGENGVGLARRAHLPTAAKARTGCLLPELRLLAVAAPHVGDRHAMLMLFRLPSARP